MEIKEKKEEKIIHNIVKSIEKMDKHLDDIKQEGKLTQTRLKEWFFDKEVLYDIRHILHEIDKYDGYNLNRIQPIDENFLELGLDSETASFMKDYFG